VEVGAIAWKMWDQRTRRPAKNPWKTTLFRVATPNEVLARAEGRVSDVAEVLVVFRARSGGGTGKHDDLLSNVPWDTPLAVFARVFKARHRAEGCLQRARGGGAGGLPGAHLTGVATWFLTGEARRGKNPKPALTVARLRGLAAGALERRRGRAGRVHEAHHEPALTPD
jgi:hypothetical protein